MNKRPIIAVAWGFVFYVCVNILFTFMFFVIEFVFSILSEQDTREIAWLSTLYTISFYATWFFMLLGCFLGFKGLLPGTRFPKEVENDPLIRLGTNEAKYASLILKTRHEKPTYLNQLKQNKKVYYLLFGLVMLGFFAAYTTNTKWLYFLVIGGAAGFIWRDFIFMFQTKIVFPFRIKIIDWEKVQEIASNAETAEINKEAAAQ